MAKKKELPNVDTEEVVKINACQKAVLYIPGVSTLEDVVEQINKILAK